jgi:hypothetical protein
MGSLGQIGKRLQIIKIAISLTDEEAIEMQCANLKLYKNDEQLESILSVLDDGNYVQASNLIDRYIEGPYDTESIFSQNETEEDFVDNGIDSKKSNHKTKHSPEEEELIKKFGLFTDGAGEEFIETMNEDAILSISESAEKEQVVSEEDEQTLPSPQPSAEEIMARYHDEEESSQDKTATMQEAENRTKEGDPDKEKSEEEKESNEPSQWSNTIEYAPISYIDQKVKNMLNQYPQIEESSEQFESEKKLLYAISLEGYTEDDIEETVEQVYTLEKEGELGEAARLLIIAASTESLYAQFILARELFRGKILQRDIPEAFTQINRMALDDYPEAVCDLAQFYENGIVVDRDKKKAFSLYQDALNLGVQRADGHLSRMQEESEGLLSRLFGG